MSCRFLVLPTRTSDAIYIDDLGWGRVIHENLVSLLSKFQPAICFSIGYILQFPHKPLIKGDSKYNLFLNPGMDWGSSRMRSESDI